MEIVINIPEEEYAKIKESANHKAIYCDLYLLMQRAVTDGIPLDKIRAEIESLQNANPSYWHRGDMVERDEVFEIIDKYKAESEE